MPSHKDVYAAIGANVAVATAKFVAAAFTGSSSMIAEGIHSTVDAGNDGLLLIGRRAREHFQWDRQRGNRLERKNRMDLCFPTSRFHGNIQIDGGGVVTRCCNLPAIGRIIDG